MSNAILQVYSAMLSVGFCIGFLLTALDWSILGLQWVGSREQVSKFIILLLLYTNIYIIYIIRSAL